MRKEEIYTIDSFQIVKSLGRGSYGAVNLVKDIETGDQFAIKEINKDYVTTKEIKEKCKICQKVCNNMKEHDENHHIKNSSSNNIEYKCDKCTLTFKDKCDVPTHIIDTHRKSTHCRKIFTTEKLWEHTHQSNT